MSHPHDALLQAHLDGELEPLKMREVTSHLSTCAACREASAELAASSYRFSEMIGRLDDAEPVEWHSTAPLPAMDVVATLDRGVGRAAHSPRLMHRAASVRKSPRRIDERPARARSLTAWRWAAAALLTVTGVAAAAVARGPLFHEPASASATVDAAPSTALPAALRPAGAIAIAPRSGIAEVTLTSAAPGSRLHVIVTDAAELTVSVRSDSASAEPARFRTSDARIAARLPSAVSIVEVEVPAAARAARVLVGDSVVVTVENGRVTPAEAATGGIALGSKP